MEKETKTKLIKLSIVIAIFVAIVLAVYLPLELTGTLSRITSIDDLKEIINSGGTYSHVIFMLIQFLQATFLPIPAMVTTLAGVYLFGPLTAFILSTVSVLLASIVSFFLGRLFGKKLADWIVGKEESDKWEAKLTKGKYVFVLMMLFPVFPDDILCIIAGMTNMTFRFFLITNLISRPLSFATICFVSSGTLIPFSGWGIPVWIILIILLAILFYLSIKYQHKIEQFFDKLAGKKAKPLKIVPTNTKSENKIINSQVVKQHKSVKTKNIKQINKRQD